MDIKTTAHKRCTVIKTGGRVDGSNAPDLGKALTAITEGKAYNIVFDMSEVTFMASAGWWVLIDAQKTCKPRGGELVLANVSKEIRDSLNLVGMGSYFQLFDDAVNAVGSF